MTRLRGWAPKGQRLVDKVPHGRWKTATFLAALRNDRIEAPCLFDGPINGERFHAYGEQFLAPTLKPGDVVILDNLGSHKAKAVRRAIRNVGARLVFLPKYSPDLNPILAKSGKERRGLPLALRDLVDKALSLRRPAANPGHIGLRPGLIDEDETPGIDQPLIGAPTRAMAAYVRAVLLARDQGLFLNVTPILRKKRLIIEVSALTPRSAERRSQRA